MWLVRYKRPKPSCHFWGAKSNSRIPRIIPIHITTKGLADHPSHPFHPTQPTNSPSPSLRLSPPLILGSEQGPVWLVLTASCYSISPNKALPTFLVWPLIKLHWLKGLRTQAGNTWRRSFQNFCERSTGGRSLSDSSRLASLPLSLGTGVFNILLRL